MKDGAIVFSTALDNREMEKQLNSLTKKIQTQTDKLNQKQLERTPLAEQSKQLATDLDAAKARLEYMKSGQEFFTANSVTQQAATVKTVQKEWDVTESKVERYDSAIAKANTELERNKEKAGAIAKRLNTLSYKTMPAFTEAVKKSQKRFATFKRMFDRTIIRATSLVFVYKAAQSIFKYFSDALKTSPQYVKAVGQLKAALLTLAQPLLNVVIPAFTALANILADVFTQLARIVSFVFGTTLDQSKKSAEALYHQTDAIKSTGKAAKKASKQLATFDEINQIGSESKTSSGGSFDEDAITPNFGESEKDNWLKDRLGGVAEMLTAGLLLGGLVLVAIGAAKGSLMATIAGLTMLGVGISVGSDTGVLQSWADTLGLNSVADFIVSGIILGGIALVAIGAAMGNILMVIKGLILIGATIVYSEKSGQMGTWYENLGLDKASTYMTAALLIGGIALIALGAALKNMLMVLAGLTLLGAGIYTGAESGTIQNWWEALHLPQYAQCVTPALLLGGIALIVFAIVRKNIMMLIGGFALLSAGVNFGIQSGIFESWWEVLKLPQVANWVETALLLGGIGLLVIGIATGNLPMLLFGLGLLGAAITFGITSGTFSRWVDDIKTGLVSGWSSIKTWWRTNVSPKLTLSFWHAKFDTIRSALVKKIKDAVNGGITLFNKFIGWINEKMNISWPALKIAGKTIIPAGSFQLIELPEIPILAQGAVIPPNREFMAVLGDQKSGNNIEAPEGLIRRIVKEESGGGNRPITVIFELDKREFGRIVYQANNEETQRVGVRFAT